MKHYIVCFKDPSKTFLQLFAYLALYVPKCLLSPLSNNKAQIKVDPENEVLLLDCTDELNIEEHS